MFFVLVVVERRWSRALETSLCEEEEEVRRVMRLRAATAEGSVARKLVWYAWSRRKAGFGALLGARL